MAIHSVSIISGLLGSLGFLVTLLMDLRRRQIELASISRHPLLANLDLLAPALTGGLATAFASKIYPNASTSGVLPLASPNVLSFFLCVVLLPVFWAEGRKQIQFQRPTGLLLAEWLFAAGAAFIVIAVFFVRREHKFLNAAIVIALVALSAGVALIIKVVPPFMQKYEGLRILERVASEEQFPQPEYTPATPECPNPELWSMFDSQTTEVEVLDFLKTLVTTIKPKLVVETGTFLGHGTVKLAEGLRENGFGKVITVEFDPSIRSRAVERFALSGLSPWIESRLESSLETIIEQPIDLLYSDSHLANREAEIRRLLPRLDPRGLLVVHDASSHFKLVREAVLRMEAEGLISAVLVSTPRGFVVAQKREGRV